MIDLVGWAEPILLSGIVLLLVTLVLTVIAIMAGLVYLVYKWAKGYRVGT